MVAALPFLPPYTMAPSLSTPYYGSDDSSDDEWDATPSEYELGRRARILANNAFLGTLGLTGLQAQMGMTPVPLTDEEVAIKAAAKEEARVVREARKALKAAAAALFVPRETHSRTSKSAVQSYDDNQAFVTDTEGKRSVDVPALPVKAKGKGKGKAKGKATKAKAKAKKVRAPAHCALSLSSPRPVAPPPARPSHPPPSH